jgi:cell fate regulator YaaT (PSP1 superfamily)
MIKRGTTEWIIFLQNLELSKSKSNRDVLCLQCWEVLKYERCQKHKKFFPDHTQSILTSKEFAKEVKFIAVARAMGKVKQTGDCEYYENPYKVFTS